MAGPERSKATHMRIVNRGLAEAGSGEGVKIGARVSLSISDVG
jgi:hypothetical protein